MLFDLQFILSGLLNTSKCPRSSAHDGSFKVFLLHFPLSAFQLYACLLSSYLQHAGFPGTNKQFLGFFFFFNAWWRCIFHLICLVMKFVECYQLMRESVMFWLNQKQKKMDKILCVKSIIFNLRIVTVLRDVTDVLWGYITADKHSAGRTSCSFG